MNNRLFVGGLNYSTSEDELRDFFESEGFSTTDVRVMLHGEDGGKLAGKSRGFGFVTLDSDREVVEAIERLHGMKLGGRRLTVNKAAPKPESEPVGERYRDGGVRARAAGNRVAVGRR